MANTLVVPGNQRPMGYQQIAGFSTLQTLAPPAGARTCIMTPTAALRYRDDGTNPTAAIGFPMPANLPFMYNGENLAAFKYIPVSGAATLDIVYYS